MLPHRGEEIKKGGNFCIAGVRVRNGASQISGLVALGCSCVASQKLQ